MLHILFVILIIILLAVATAIAVGAYMLHKGIRLFRNAAGKATGRDSRDAAGSRQRQGAGSQSRHTSFADSGETIIDTRDRATINRRIFADDEGEYVDYIEEK